MFMRHMPMIEARSKLTKLASQLEQDPEEGAIAVTRRGKPVLALMNWDLYEAVLETLEVMKDKKLMEALACGIKEMEQGKGIPWKKAKKDLGL